MSGKSAADDFFGIEYMSSRSTTYEDGNKVSFQLFYVGFWPSILDVMLARKGALS